MELTATQVSWMLVMDYCVTDLEKIGGLKAHADVSYRTEELMLDLLTQTARGMDYIHSAEKMHWDLKPENVLVGNVGTEFEPQWVARVADFGMAAAEKIPDWVGTFLFMAPEATQLNKDDGEQFGQLGPKADVFSFGIMVWMIFARKYRWFEDESTLSGFRPGFQMPTTTGKDGKHQEDMKQVARWYYLGHRPGFDGLSFPPKLVILVEACWAAKQSDRPPFSDVLRVMESSAAQLLEREPEPESEPEITYGEFLAQLGMQDQKELLAEFLSEPGAELVELKQMSLEDLDDDILQDSDLGLDGKTQAHFRAAVQALPHRLPPDPYDEWLLQLGMLDKKEALAELLAAGSELQELKQMAPDDLADDVLEDEDLDLDANDKSRFRQAVEKLSMGDDGSDQGSAATATAEDSAQPVRAAFKSLLAEAQLVNSMSELLVPTWDQEEDNALSSASNARRRWNTAGNALGALGRLRSGSDRATGASLLGDGEDDNSDGGSAFISMPEPDNVSRQMDWPQRKFGKEFAELELPPVNCDWDGEPQISLMTASSPGTACAR